MGSAPSLISLDPDRPKWEQQPKEPAKRYAYFETFLKMGRVRSIAKTAEAHVRNASYMRQLAAAGLWQERAQAWDAHRSEEYLGEMIEQARQAARTDAKLLDVTVGMIARGLKSLDPEELTPAELTRLMDVTLRYRRTLFGDPTDHIRITGPDGGPVAVEVTEFDGLTQREQNAKILDLVEATKRRLQAVEASDP